MIVMTYLGKERIHTHMRAHADQSITLSFETLDAAAIKQMTETRLD